MRFFFTFIIQGGMSNFTGPEAEGNMFNVYLCYIMHTKKVLWSYDKNKKAVYFCNDKVSHN